MCENGRQIFHHNQNNNSMQQSWATNGSRLMEDSNNNLAFDYSGTHLPDESNLSDYFPGSEVVGMHRHPLHRPSQWLFYENQLISHHETLRSRKSIPQLQKQARSLNELDSTDNPNNMLQKSNGTDPFILTVSNAKMQQGEALKMQEYSSQKTTALDAYKQSGYSSGVCRQLEDYQLPKSLEQTVENLEETYWNSPSVTPNEKIVAESLSRVSTEIPPRKSKELQLHSSDSEEFPLPDDFEEFTKNGIHPPCPNILRTLLTRNRQNEVNPERTCSEFEKQVGFVSSGNFSLDYDPSLKFQSTDLLMEAGKHLFNGWKCGRTDNEATCSTNSNEGMSSKPMELGRKRESISTSWEREQQVRHKIRRLSSDAYEITDSRRLLRNGKTYCFDD